MRTIPTTDEQLRAEVSKRYAKTALQVLGTQSKQQETSCCGPTCCTDEAATATTPVLDASPRQDVGCCASSCCTSATDGSAITANLYNQEELATLPIGAALASLGCGNPTALAELQPGERVLDLGSGGGIDVLLSARRVGPTGWAFGLDMTDAMLELAERNRREAGVENVTFLKGIIERIPLPAESVDVVISNCVINLSADKAQVIHEAYRVLAPGGRFAVSDVVFQGSLPAVLKRDMESWAGCVAGALEEQEYREHLTSAGFTDIEVEVTRRYSLDDLTSSGASDSLQALSETERAAVDGTFVSAFIRASKPA